MNLLVNKCYPDMFELLDMIEWKQGRKRSREPKSGFSERRAQRAAERELKRKEKEEKRARKAELKDAWMEQKRIWKEEKLWEKEEYWRLKREYSNVPKAVIWEANEHYSNKEMLVNYLKGIDF